jgi:hypothetical protein
MTLRRLPLVLPALALCFACVSNPPAGSGTPSSGAAAPAGKGDAKGKGDEADDKADKQKKKERELAYAQKELDITKMSVAAEERESKTSVEDADFKLQMANRERDNFKNFEKPYKLADSALDIDRVAERMKESQQELDELKAMYKQEDLAKLTKELVISRGEANLAFAKRNLELEQQKATNMKEHELSKKEKELDQAVGKAEKAVMEAKEKQRKGAAESELKLKKAQDHIEELQTELEKMKKKDEGKKEEKKEEKKEAQP